jgi:hypothetical protein
VTTCMVNLCLLPSRPSTLSMPVSHRARQAGPPPPRDGSGYERVHLEPGVDHHGRIRTGPDHPGDSGALQQAAQHGLRTDPLSGRATSRNCRSMARGRTRTIRSWHAGIRGQPERHAHDPTSYPRSVLSALGGSHDTCLVRHARRLGERPMAATERRSRGSAARGYGARLAAGCGRPLGRRGGGSRSVPPAWCRPTSRSQKR